MKTNTIFLMVILSVVISGAGCGVSQSAFPKSYASSKKTPPLSDQNANDSAVIKLLGKNNRSVFYFTDFKGRLIGFRNTGIDLLINDSLLAEGKAGTSWNATKVLPKLDKSPGFKDIFVKDDQLWAVAGDLVLNKKGDDEWKKVARLPTYELSKIAFADEKTGYILSRIPNEAGPTGSQVYKTTDGGVTWKKVYRSMVTGTPCNMLVINDQRVILALNDNYLLQTADGGRSWAPQGLENDKLSFREDGWVKLNNYGAYKLIRSPDNKIWVVGDKGSIYYSEDQGLTWSRPQILPDDIKDKTLSSIDFSAEGKGLVTGPDNYIMLTTDFGKSWIGMTLAKEAQAAELEQLWQAKFIGERGILVGTNAFYEADFSKIHQK